MGNHVHRWLAASVAAIALGAFAGWRSLGDGPTGPNMAAKPIPSPQLSQLMPYTEPSADTVATLRRGDDSIMLARDPFGPGTVPRPIRVVRRPTPVMANSSGASLWDVTATLIAGGRRAAVINDVLIYVGDDVPWGGREGGGTLTAVERDHIVITDSKGTAHKLAVKERDG